MAKQYKAIHPVKYYRDYLSHDVRPDGRNLFEFRPILINVDSIATTVGSSIVKIGNTTVVCGIKAELAQPKAEEPNKGFLIPNVELPPLCSPKFRPGPPSDQAQVTSCLIADLITNSKCIDLTELCIHPERLAWVLFCDLICLDHDGSLTDACLLALISALKTVKLPEVKFNAELNSKLVLEGVKKPLNVKTTPVSSTFAIFDDSVLLADPTTDEENLCTGIVTVTVTDSELCSVHKPGGSPLSDEQIQKCIQETKNQHKLIISLINNATVKKEKES